MYNIYETVIGLEIHVELATKSKIFCGCSTDFGGTPNSHTCPICLGLPGAKPSLNRKVIEYAVAAGLATNCSISRVIQFDRKNYFYPDNPHNYQISQLYHPICEKGLLEGKRIREIHMEEDAGKLIHSEDEKYTYVDFNRAGIPLLEIVTEPDFRNATEVVEFLEKLRLLFVHLGISDCKLQEGSMRVDVNLSVKRRDEEKLGVRTEMKNLGSFRAIRRAIEAESIRQINCMEKGEEILQETRRFHEGKNLSVPMRLKESAADYRYFPDPDVPLIVLDEDFLQMVRDNLPELPNEKKKRYMECFGLSSYDADVLLQEIELSHLFEETVAEGADAKSAANWLMGELMYLWKEEPNDRKKVSPKSLAALIDMVSQKKINSTVAKTVFGEIYRNQVDPKEYVEARGLYVVRDNDAIEGAVKKITEENSQAVADYKNGKRQAFGYLVGQSMKALNGKADPARVSQVLSQYLENLL